MQPMSRALAQFQLLEVLLEAVLLQRCRGQTGGKVLWLLNPQLVLHASFLQLRCQVQELRLPFHLQHNLVHVI